MLAIPNRAFLSSTLIPILLVGLLGALGCRSAQHPSAPWVPDTSPTYESEDSPADKLTLEKLAKHISVAMDAVHLGAALDQIRQLTGVEMNIDWQALATVEVTKETPVTLKLANVTGNDALRLMLAQITTHPDNDATYEISEGMVSVSTASSLSSLTEIRIYDLGVLMTQSVTGTIDWAHIPPLHPPGIAPVLYATTSPATTESCFPVPATASAVLAERLDMLENLLATTVGKHDDWMPGGACTMQEYMGHLVVRAPPPVQRELRRVLGQVQRELEYGMAAELRHEAVIELLGKADALRHQQRYEAAMKLTDEALAIDPHHPWARAMKQVLEERKERRDETH